MIYDNWNRPSLNLAAALVDIVGAASSRDPISMAPPKRSRLEAAPTLYVYINQHMPIKIPQPGNSQDRIGVIHHEIKSKAV
jgi:hypothetical protein